MNGESNSRGVAILVKKSFKDKIRLCDVKNNIDGRVIKCVINHDDQNVCLVNIYAPNKDSPVFFERVLNSAQEECDKLIVVGDYNTVIDPTMDRKNMEKNLPSSS